MNGSQDMARCQRKGGRDEDDTTPLLESQTHKPLYETFPDSRVDEIWKPGRGFWWVECALWANVFLSGFDGTITASTYAAISSDFNASNNAAWLTTSYLITSTAFQPTYGRLSDMFGRRICFFVSTWTFMLGCFGCSLAPSMLMLNLCRGLTGFGGGGLITMATVINSDMIPFKQRGHYQAIQNCLVGLGAVLGASLGGLIVEGIGWRFCFLLQVPVSIVALIVGWIVLENPPTIMDLDPERRFRSAFKLLDFSGSITLVCGLIFQLLGLTFGGNMYDWRSAPVIATLLASVLFLAGFCVIEAKTEAIPMIPLRMLSQFQPVVVQVTNVFVGMSSYAYMFMVPLYFQAVRGDSPTAAGLRLIAPSLATPVGGIIAGVMMSRGYRLCHNVQIGTSLMLLGNLLAIVLGTGVSRWVEMVYLVPANLGLGLTNPSCLFSFVSLFQHTEQAVASSVVYLIRSLGSIYGVTITASVVQNILVAGLPDVLGDDATEELIERLRKSVFALLELPIEQQIAIRELYGKAIRVSFAVSSIFALLAFLFSLFHRTGNLQRK